MKLMKKVYAGTRDRDGAVRVTVNGKPLNPRLDRRNHSPTGFDWGYGGSGPAQLALALLADHLNNDERAVALHQCFKRSVVAGLSPKGWRLTSDQIERALQPIMRSAGSMGCVHSHE